MTKYRNLSGNAGITAYKILKDGIVLEFGTTGSYLYDYGKPGKEHVERMKILAKKGKGLTTYVNQYIKENYSIKY